MFILHTFFAHMVTCGCMEMEFNLRLHRSHRSSCESLIASREINSPVAPGTQFFLNRAAEKLVGTVNGDRCWVRALTLNTHTPSSAANMLMFATLSNASRRICRTIGDET